MALHHRERCADAILRLAHQLKSTARTVGALPLGDCCAALQDAARRANWDAIDEGIPTLQRLLHAVAADAQAWLTENTGIDAYS
jgi:HPt (histidine-containing phosphotransfer) domain-containing protein